MPKLQELHDKRIELAANLRTLADKFNAEGYVDTADDQASWAKANADYDANYKLLQAEQKVVEDAANRKKDRDTLIASLDTADKEFVNSLGGGDIEKGPVNKDRFNHASSSDFNKTQVMALQGWMLANSPQLANQITPEHVDAAKKMRINFQDREVVLRIGNTMHFRNAQRAYLGGTVTNAHGQVMNGQFLNALLEGQLSKGGVLVGETLLNRLEQALLDYSGVMQVAEIIRTTTGEALIWPTVDDTANSGTRVGESQDAGTAADPTFGRLRLQAFTYTSGQLNVSRSLLADSSVVNLEELIGEMLGTRIGRKQNVDFTTGTGGGTEPLGIVTASGLGKTAASATAFLFDELIDLEHSVDPAYRRQAGVGYMMHDLILAIVRKLKNGNGDYLWSRGADAMAPDRINGYSYWINQAMASTIVSGTKSILFGLLRNYKVRQVNELRIQRLIERRAEYDEDVFIAYMRADGGLLNAGVNPVKHLVH